METSIRSHRIIRVDSSACVCDYAADNTLGSHQVHRLDLTNIQPQVSLSLDLVAMAGDLRFFNDFLYSSVYYVLVVTE